VTSATREAYLLDETERLVSCSLSVGTRRIV
jgi:hypothetical protein